MMYVKKLFLPFLLHLSLTLQLLGWKELPPEDPLLSAYIKVLGQEIAFVDIDNGIIQQAMKVVTRLLPFLSVLLNNFPPLTHHTCSFNSFLFLQSLTGSSSWQPAVKRAVEEAQRGVSGQWALPAVVAELRHTVPMVLGLPLELSVCGAALAQATAAGERGTPNSNSFPAAVVPSLCWN